MQQSRKRPAPGASPLVQQQPTPPQPTYQYPQIPENVDYSGFDFSQPFNADQSFSDPTFAPSNDYSYLQNTAQPAAYGNSLQVPAASPSTDLVRRAPSQQVVSQQQEQWNGQQAGYGGSNMNGRQAEEEDEQDLDRKVQLAKRDAQGKRKQIPPFVQKLSR